MKRMRDSASLNIIMSSRPAQSTIFVYPNPMTTAKRTPTLFPHFSGFPIFRAERVNRREGNRANK